MKDTELLYNNVLQLFHELVCRANKQLLDIMYSHPEHVKLSAPEFLITLLKNANKYQFDYLSVNSKERLTYHGIEVINNYQMEIVLFHKDYPIYQHPWMIEKILFMPPVEEESKWYSKMVISIKEYYPTRNDSIFSNN